MFRELLRLVGLVASASVATSGVASASSVEVFSYSAVAQSPCATSGPAPGLPAYLYTVPFAVGCPGQDLQVATAASGPLATTSSGSVAGAISSFSPPWSASVSSSATASIGSLGSVSSGTLDGATDGFSWHGTESFARFTQNMTFTSGVGADVAHFRFTVDGSLAWSINGDGQMLLLSRYSGSLSDELELRLDYGISGADVLLDGVYRYLPPHVNTLPPEIVLTTTPTSGRYDVNGLDVFIDVPFLYGTPFDLTVTLATASLPGASPAASVPASLIQSDFFSTAKLTGVTVESGTAFLILTDNDVRIDADGVHLPPTGVPGPSPSALMGLGLLALGIARTRMELR